MQHFLNVLLFLMLTVGFRSHYLFVLIQLYLYYQLRGIVYYILGSSVKILPSLIGYVMSKVHAGLGTCTVREEQSQIMQFYCTC